MDTVTQNSCRKKSANNLVIFHRGFKSHRRLTLTIPSFSVIYINDISSFIFLWDLDLISARNIWFISASYIIHLNIFLRISGTTTTPHSCPNNPFILFANLTVLLLLLFSKLTFFQNPQSQLHADFILTTEIPQHLTYTILGISDLYACLLYSSSSQTTNRNYIFFICNILREIWDVGCTHITSGPADIITP